MSHKELAARMREHARIHRDHVPQDDEQQQWADDLEHAARLVEESEMGLKAEGFRFARVKANDYRWIHPAEMQVGYIDCTDMTDDEFTALVRDDHDQLAVLVATQEEQA